ncbi:hypothetical protein BHF68_04880 [Desulfuribacillus alkaliarsenatis]|uniref:DUF1850 domain-containing protein n=1 Tax=Desulfuribacillus alkaliarsenatis TaxID=766136 RepID=A0A1E5G3B3_9FIRM|nr:hypothetical protein BHF68_04880 [Desulfuribacillus alkaliarsenatis]
MSTSKGAHYFPFFLKLGFISSIVLLLFFLLYSLIASFDKSDIEQALEDEKSNMIESLQLYIVDGRTKDLLYNRNIEVEETFTLEYIHSVTNRRVFEEYRVYNEQQIEIYEMRFDEFGANLPVGPEQVDGFWTEFIVSDEYYIVRYQNRLFDRIPLQVGIVVADHTIVFADGERLRLRDIITDRSFIEILVILPNEETA